MNVSPIVNTVPTMSTKDSAAFSLGANNTKAPQSIRSNQQQHQHHLPSLSQVIAMTLTYRRILAVWGSPPLLAACFPVVWTAVLMIFDKVTKGYGLLVLFFTVAFTLFTYDLIRRKAPSKAALADALAKSEMRIPLIMFVFSCFLVRGIIDPVASYVNFPWSLKYTTQEGFGNLLASSVRVSLAMALLGLAVVVRFVGPSSIVRCSSRPLASNPFVMILSSLPAFLYVIAGPNNNNNINQSFNNGEKSNNHPGTIFKRLMHQPGCSRRFQYPEMLKMISIIVLSIFIGMVVAYTTVFDWLLVRLEDSRLAKLGITLTCALAVPGQLMFSSFHRAACELNPKQNLMNIKTTVKQQQHYPSSNSAAGHQFSFKRFSALIQYNTTSMFLVPFVAVVGVYFFEKMTVTTQGDTNDGNIISRNDMIRLFAFCFSVAVLIILYLTIIDEVMRSVLYTPGGRIRRFAEEMSGISSQETCADVIVHSVLYEHPGLIHAVWSPTADPLQVDLEIQEANRNANAIVTMAEVLLHSEHRGKHSEAPLEEDILRYSILESLGGGGVLPSQPGNNSNKQYLNIPEPRHIENIREWIQPDHKVVLGGKQREPLVATIVRTLCAYIGGLGEALLCISSSTEDNSKQHNNDQSNTPPLAVVRWIVPPGASAAAEHSVVALARCLAWTFNGGPSSSDTPVSNSNSASASWSIMSDWRTTHLSVFVPTVLNCMFRLKKGIEAYAMYRLRQRNESGFSITRIGIESPELLRVYHACDDAAMSILEPLLKSHHGNLSRLRLDRTLSDEKCYQWVCQLVQ